MRTPVCMHMHIYMYAGHRLGRDAMPHMPARDQFARQLQLGLLLPQVCTWCMGAWMHGYMRAQGHREHWEGQLSFLSNLPHLPCPLTFLPPCIP